MKIKKGTYRIVLIFEKFVIKFPIISPISAVSSTIFFLKRKSFLRSLKFYFYGYVVGPQHYLFRGIAENWSEFCFYRKYKFKFLVPTYFSLFGFFSVQKFVNQLNLSIEIENDFEEQVCRITNKEVYIDPHHFLNPKNFSKENGKLQIIDYAGPHTQEVLVKYADKLYEEFKF